MGLERFLLVASQFTFYLVQDVFEAVLDDVVVGPVQVTPHPLTVQVILTYFVGQSVHSIFSLFLLPLLLELLEASERSVYSVHSESVEGDLRGAATTPLTRGVAGDRGVATAKASALFLCAGVSLNSNSKVAICSGVNVI